MNPFDEFDNKPFTEYENHFDSVLIEEPIEDKEEKTTEVKKCPSCGANLIWSPEDSCLLCEHCGTKVEIDLDKYGEELDFSRMFHNNNSWSLETHVFRCNNCGAKEVLSKKEISVTCPFCGTTNVVETDELSGLKPNAVIPFAIDKENACKRVMEWAKKKFFANKKFKDNVYPDAIKGNYSPAFTFDSKTSSSYQGVLGEYYYVQVKRNGKTYSERKTRYKRISGNYYDFYNDILVQASNQIDQKTIEKLQPFDVHKSNQYSEEFLHGFTANQYSKTGEQCWSEARADIESDLKRKILAQYKYDFVQSFNCDTYCSDIKFRYLLLPIYIGHCKWKNKLYNFYVNGYNGKVVGKTPLSPLRIGLVTFITAALIVGVSMLLYYFL